ncbi:hypothetical protein A2617_04850 [Candidatus Daviesbacteria bacterium RIFOXYD1_FULL_41_10]|uniref:RRM domain-containing protein n=2 Tax=Candidatus Daviesiibacteriota TaxID=1752718 RepID=A0A1F5N2V6_9BACT|nr:MAG: RNP-1 like protein RNA-binding protein [Candidatus Daviesbacteria bacterium GW2011_GWB1_41_5]OGE71974.1 MAG: hypothetical protein A2617_04850 [Candidatus Daviesbacteria bacterium RIFOXYD1_FULL_41_10]
MTKLFVGGLPYSLTSDELRDIFSKVGAVLSATVITDKFSGQSKGFGFVEMEKDEEGQKAIQDLNETEVQGRKIFVSVARPREERPQDGGFGGGRGTGGRDFNRGGGFGGGRDRGGRGR